jgi:predicted transcriptional regulator
LGISTSNKKRTSQEILAFIFERGNKISMSHRTISKNTGHSISTVARTISQLEQQGLIRIEKAEKQSTPSTIVYTGPRKVKRPVVELLNSVLNVCRKMLSTITHQLPKEEYMDRVINEPMIIDPSKILLLKELTKMKAEIIIVKK